MIENSIIFLGDHNSGFSELIELLKAIGLEVLAPSTFHEAVGDILRGSAWLVIVDIHAARVGSLDFLYHYPTLPESFKPKLVIVTDPKVSSEILFCEDCKIWKKPINTLIALQEIQEKYRDEIL